MLNLTLIRSALVRSSVTSIGNHFNVPVAKRPGQRVNETGIRQDVTEMERLVKGMPASSIAHRVTNASCVPLF